jgi:hypothetical protein
MPKFRYIALATAAVMVLGAPAGAAYAASAHKAPKPVLTIGKKGGTAVGKGAVLTAGLARKTSVVLALGTYTATCTSSTLTAKVTGNPARSGKATLSLTRQTIKGCSISVTGVTLKSLTALNLPYNVTISTARRDPVTIAGRRASKPLSFEAAISVGTLNLTCVYTAASASGHASNTGNKVTFAAQKFSLDTTLSSSLCSSAGASTATFSATYGPVRDTSVRHHPKVFVR